MASASELAYIYSALILHPGKVVVMEDKISVLISEAGTNAEPFWPGLFAKGLANVSTGSLAAPAGGPAFSTTAAPAEEKKVEEKKEDSKASDDDMGFGVFHSIFC
ncbi:60S acidic ribosomal protein P1-like [Chionomys nivalis]|uniref:60S acidic ribosomal protein P1-like n=1 Tax=Chionomys nivalis TaxID=269649 RepID=UPI0025999FAA|nr:60S acidic ribosomal protein P1-like [Chionomys nivalis]